jgi:hypothetical protein
LSGDEIAHDLGIDTISKSSETYVAVATEAHITAIVTERTEKNEISRPQNSTPVSYSVPIDVEFLSNPNKRIDGLHRLPQELDARIELSGPDPAREVRRFGRTGAQPTVYQVADIHTHAMQRPS